MTTDAPPGSAAKVEVMRQKEPDVGLMRCRFYLGVHEPGWLPHAGTPLFLSAVRLRRRRSLPRAGAPWSLDSGGFSELSLRGTWTVDAASYAAEVRRWSEGIGRMQWAAAQDWMCEGFILEKTGLTVAEHQRRTVANYLLLRQLAPEVPWLPVIQGYTLAEYRDCIHRYTDAGVALTMLPCVGVGSICRRQGTDEVAEIIRFVRGWGIKPHAFGMKLQGLAKVAHLVESADSMAWSYEARRSAPLPGCPHKSCANCLKYALAWRDRAAALCEDASPRQKWLFV